MDCLTLSFLFSVYRLLEIVDVDNCSCPFAASIGTRALGFIHSYSSSAYLQFLAHLPNSDHLAFSPVSYFSLFLIHLCVLGTFST